jgi:hypothetical protein
MEKMSIPEGLDLRQSGNSGGARLGKPCGDLLWNGEDGPIIQLGGKFHSLHLESPAGLIPTVNARKMKISAAFAGSNRLPPPHESLFPLHPAGPRFKKSPPACKPVLRRIDTE